MAYKQVLVIAKYLGMRAGKMVAQGAHAAMMPILVEETDSAKQDADLQAWFDSGMTKVCLRVDSEEEFTLIQKQAREKGLRVYVITDAGRTEFKGVPTQTCIAIGPNQEELINEVTGHLKLL